AVPNARRPQDAKPELRRKKGFAICATGCTFAGSKQRRRLPMPVFHIEIVKPSHYDKQGYVIQWWKAWIPSNSMACLYGIAQDWAEGQVLGQDVTIEVDAHDEMNIRIPVERIARKLKRPGHDGFVCLVGVQSNQFPRAMAIARQLRARGVKVAIGGFHVS